MENEIKTKAGLSYEDATKMLNHFSDKLNEMVDKSLINKEDKDPLTRQFVKHLSDYVEADIDNYKIDQILKKFDIDTNYLFDAHLELLKKVDFNLSIYEEDEEELDEKLLQIAESVWGSDYESSIEKYKIIGQTVDQLVFEMGLILLRNYDNLKYELNKFPTKNREKISALNDVSHTINVKLSVLMDKYD
ncbi:MAG: hypothetical protein J7J92_01455 [Candidatus Aenigmarchaeota archaeon]|nr:hypothetical protein [Candidatus Aenigmarchaeota archaeon]